MTREEVVAEVVFHALTIVSERGAWKKSHETFSLRVATIDTLILGYRAPAEKLPSPQFRLQTAIEPAGQDFPYGLDIWFGGRKMMFASWDDAGNFIIHLFKSGDWEQVVALAASAESDGA